MGMKSDTKDKKAVEKPLHIVVHEVYFNGEWEEDIEYKCYAPKTWYREWEEWTDDDKAILEKHEPNGLNCEGGLYPGEHCGFCPFVHPLGYGE